MSLSFLPKARSSDSFCWKFLTGPIRASRYPSPLTRGTVAVSESISSSASSPAFQDFSPKSAYWHHCLLPVLSVMTFSLSSGVRHFESTGTEDWQEAQTILRQRLQARDENSLNVVRNDRRQLDLLADDN